MRQVFRTMPLALCSLLSAIGVGWAAPAAAPDQAGRLAWFNKAKFGLFVHWGLYAVPAGEWGEGKDYGEWIMLQANIPARRYEQLAAQFNPVRFDAKEWVALAKEAGMNYLVVTAKHHDGFSMFDSKLTDYDVVDATPFKRDPLKELSEESRRAGLKFCAYYSIVDWHHPEFPARYSQVRRPFPDGFHGDPHPNADLDKYVAYQNGQIRELLTSYGELGILWFDGGGSFRNRDRETLLHGKELVQMIHSLQPGVLINNRLGFGADYGTPEQSIPASALGTAFEVCMTLNRHWGFNRNDHDWKSAKTIIRNLAEIASKGGNYLLNVGPTAEGMIPPESAAVLREVGRWLRVNGEAIYDTTAGPPAENVRAGSEVFMTRKPGRLFLIVADWPRDQRIFMEGMKGGLVKSVYRLDDPERRPLQFERHERSVLIQLSAAPADERAPVLVIELQGDALEDGPGGTASAAS